VNRPGGSILPNNRTPGACEPYRDIIEGGAIGFVRSTAMNLIKKKL
jgi:hypothetical protein